ncbi:hypothetical protein [Scopulibacillus cellulosilyticus]|uniref:Uncharacterized protein n=1 Tax=Scopulibacillus cellulosilyticus TaxID=2665665 RepID=A0ABW2Q4E7_9BACL
MTHHIAIEKNTNTYATVSITLALIGFAFGLIPVFGWLMFRIWMLAIFYGAVGLFKPYKRGLATAGIVVGALTLIYKIAFFHALIG